MVFFRINPENLVCLNPFLKNDNIPANDKKSLIKKTGEILAKIHKFRFEEHGVISRNMKTQSLMPEQVS